MAIHWSCQWWLFCCMPAVTMLTWKLCCCCCSFGISKAPPPPWVYPPLGGKLVLSLPTPCCAELGVSLWGTTRSKPKLYLFYIHIRIRSTWVGRLKMKKWSGNESIMKIGSCCNTFPCKPPLIKNTNILQRLNTNAGTAKYFFSIISDVFICIFTLHRTA